MRTPPASRGLVTQASIPATVLERLAAEHGCGFDCDDVNRRQFLTVTAQDIKAMNGLAAAVLAAADQFGPGSVVVPSR